MAKDMTLNRKSKDSVFVKFFQEKKNILQMYKEFHPEMTDLTDDDIDIKTLESVIVNTLYNDLGFIVKDKYVMLVEAQSSWNPNMAVRMMFYLCETFRRYIIDTEQSEHSDTQIKLPEPELYVFYSGDGHNKEVISLNEDFFGGKSCVDVKVRVLNKVDTSISGQYIGFCKVFNEQRKIYEDGIKSAKVTYRICIEKGYLVDFMKKHESEVIDMMSELFDEELMREQYDRAEKKRNFNEGITVGEAIGIEKGKAEGLLEALKKLVASGMSESEAKKILGIV